MYLREWIDGMVCDLSCFVFGRDSPDWQAGSEEG